MLTNGRNTLDYASLTLWSQGMVSPKDLAKKGRPRPKLSLTEGSSQLHFIISYSTISKNYADMVKICMSMIIVEQDYIHSSPEESFTPFFFCLRKYNNITL